MLFLIKGPASVSIFLLEAVQSQGFTPLGGHFSTELYTIASFLASSCLFCSARSAAKRSASGNVWGMAKGMIAFARRSHSMKYRRACLPLALRSTIASSLVISSVRAYSLLGQPPWGFSPISAKTAKSWFSTKPYCAMRSLIQFEKSFPTSRNACNSRALTVWICAWPIRRWWRGISAFMRQPSEDRFCLQFRRLHAHCAEHICGGVLIDGRLANGEGAVSTQFNIQPRYAVMHMDIAAL